MQAKSSIPKSIYSESSGSPIIGLDFSSQDKSNTDIKSTKKTTNLSNSKNSVIETQERKESN